MRIHIPASLLLAGAIILISLVVLAACDTAGNADTPTPIVPTMTPTPAAHPASQEDRTLILEAITATHTLSSYHFRLEQSADNDPQISSEEGDFVAPDHVYLRVNETGEFLDIGDREYYKDGGVWVEQTQNKIGGAATLASTFTDMYLARYIAAGVPLTDTGTLDTLDGVPTQHFRFTLDARSVVIADLFMGDPNGFQDPRFNSRLRASLTPQHLAAAPALGDGEVWIDATARQLHRFRLTFNQRDFNSIKGGHIERLLTPQPTPAVPTPTLRDAVLIFRAATLSRLNDPTVSVPQP